MSRCRLCFSVMRHEAEYVLTFGKDERVLEVCRYCREDLALLGFRANRVVRLEVAGRVRRCFPFCCFVVLGPVCTLLLGVKP